MPLASLVKPSVKDNQLKKAEEPALPLSNLTDSQSKSQSPKPKPPRPRR